MSRCLAGQAPFLAGLLPDCQRLPQRLLGRPHVPHIKNQALREQEAEGDPTEMEGKCVWRGEGFPM